MALDVWFTSDIQANVLAGLLLVIETANAHGCVNTDYCAGVLAMARHTAIAHQVCWPDLIRDARQALGDDLADLLDAVTVHVLEGSHAGG